MEREKSIKDGGRIAVMSDVHANPDAFRRAIDSALRLGCDRFICCGDVVGYGYDPNGCIALCREYGFECVKGNHDAGVTGELSLRWFNEFAAGQVKANKRLLSDGNIEWLRSLPYSAELDLGGETAVVAHGSYSSPEQFFYVAGILDARTEIDALSKSGKSALFIGHTHYAEAYLRDTCGVVGVDRIPVQEEMPDQYVLGRKQWGACGVFNCGSVGYPRNGEFCTYMVVEPDSLDVMWERVPFDYSDYATRMGMAGMSVPRWMTDRMRNC